MVEIEIIPFTNEFGNVIQPGDKVIVITESYKSVSIKKGTYLGQRNGNVVAEVEDRRYRYNYETKKGGYEDCIRRCHLQRNRIYPAVTPIGSLSARGCK